jgi:hypothetical protein
MALSPKYLRRASGRGKVTGELPNVKNVRHKWTDGRFMEWLKGNRIPENGRFP